MQIATALRLVKEFVELLHVGSRNSYSKYLSAKLLRPKVLSVGDPVYVTMHYPSKSM